jgi:hypothetical protein
MASPTAFCLICARATHDKYCDYHCKSFDKLVSRYESWKRALGEISWEDYLTKLLELQETGSSIRDIIEKELQIQ